MKLIAIAKAVVSDDSFAKLALHTPKNIRTTTDMETIRSRIFADECLHGLNDTVPTRYAHWTTTRPKSCPKLVWLNKTNVIRKDLISQMAPHHQTSGRYFIIKNDHLFRNAS